MCRWGALAYSPRRAAYRIPRPPSLMQQESAEGSGLRGEALEILTVISAWKPAQRHPTCRNKTGLWNQWWACPLFMSVFPLPVSHRISRETCNRIDRLRETLATSIYYSLMRMTSCNMQASQWLTIRCWFLQAGRVKKITRCWCHAPRTDWPHYREGEKIQHDKWKRLAACTLGSSTVYFRSNM